MRTRGQKTAMFQTVSEIMDDRAAAHQILTWSTGAPLPQVTEQQQQQSPRPLPPTKKRRLSPHSSATPPNARVRKAPGKAKISPTTGKTRGPVVGGMELEIAVSAPHEQQADATVREGAINDAQCKAPRRVLQYMDTEASATKYEYAQSSTATATTTHELSSSSVDTRDCLERLSRRNLSASVKLVGRVKERLVIRDFLVRRATSSLFVVGPSGTGKTSSMDDMLNGYVSVQPNTVIVRLNCSSFSSPVGLFAEIDAQLTAKTSVRLPYFDAHLLDEFLTHTRRTHKLKPVVIILLDEVDLLLNFASSVQPRVKDLLCFLVRLSEIPGFRFVGILNGGDMHTRIRSFLPTDCSIGHLLYPSYTHPELLQILESFVKHTAGASAKVEEIVDAKALELIARKVAARDGDARQVINLLNQSAIAALQRCEPSTASACITLRDVLQSSNQVQASQVVRDIQQLPRLSKIVLVALTRLAPCNAKPCEPAQVGNELAALRDRFEWIPAFKRDELQDHMSTLECCALIKRAGLKATSTTNFWKLKVSSCATTDQLTRALQGDDVLEMLAVR